MKIHLEVLARLQEYLAGDLSQEVTLAQDALQIALHNGVYLEIRYLSISEYSFSWTWGESVWRIDTAPLHRDLESFPNHLHRDSGALATDIWTEPGTSPWDNICRVIDVLRENPAAFIGDA